jgi:hypothetical protein
MGVALMTSDDVMEHPERGYVLAYGRDSGDLSFNIMAFLAVLLLGLSVVTNYAPLLMPAVAAACVAYYHYPLKERTPRIGAGQYGIFIDGLGLIGWRSISNIDAVPTTSKLGDVYELQIRLNKPLDYALLADWRRLPIWRLLMKLPWNMSEDDLIRIPLKVFDPPAQEIRSNFIRLSDHFR